MSNNKSPGNDGLSKGFYEDQNKRFIKNWRSISLLNVDAKILSKAFAAKLKPILPSIISSNQTAYIETRCINESGRLVSDIIEISNIPGFLVTMNLEKAFDLCLKKNLALVITLSRG